MKSFPVWEYRTKLGVDYRIATARTRRHGDKYVGDIASESKVDAIAKLKLYLRLAVNTLVKE